MSKTQEQAEDELARILGIATDLWGSLKESDTPRIHLGLALAEAEERGVARKREALSAIRARGQGEER